MSVFPAPPETAMGKADLDADVLVAGAGAVGLAIALAVARSGARTVVAGPLDVRRTGRTVALLEGSVDVLRALGVWAGLASHAAPLRVMRLVDDTGSLFRPPPVRFEAAEIGRDAFGFNVENATLVGALAAAARELPNLVVADALVADYCFGAERVTATLSDGRRVSARLVAAADGRSSPARIAADVGARTWAYPQTALTALLRHSRPHRDTSTEFHTRQGPFTLVPLPALEGARHRSSLVWVMTPGEARRRGRLDKAAFAREIDERGHHLLGEVEVEGDVGSFPIRGLAAARLTAPRLALAGEAAHAFPPIGAQGLNLGLRDADVLARLVGEAARSGADPGSPALLDRYARERRTDVALRTLAVGGLNRALLADLVPLDLVRGMGLLALGAFGPARRLVMRAGLGAPADGRVDAGERDRPSRAAGR